MHRLSPSELECLQKLLNNIDTCSNPCSEQDLSHLESLGLAEKVFLVWLPLEMQQYHYRITSLGQQTLLSNRS